MRNLITSILILFVGCTFSMNLMAQAPSDETVTLVSSGEGATKDEAIKKALLNAIEQTYGTFVSSNTTILNDELIQDEIVTVSSGNVKSYEILSEEKRDGNYLVTISSVISIESLASFVRSKGGEAELAGATFAMNVKLEKFYADAETKALKNLLTEMSSVKNIFDFEIEVKDPKENHDGKYDVDIAVYANVNENGVALFGKILYTLLTLSSDENGEVKKRTPAFISLLPNDNNHFQSKDDICSFLDQSLRGVFHNINETLDYMPTDLRNLFLTDEAEFGFFYFRSAGGDLRDIMKALDSHLDLCSRSFILSDGINDFDFSNCKHDTREGKFGLDGLAIYQDNASNKTYNVRNCTFNGCNLPYALGGYIYLQFSPYVVPDLYSFPVSTGKWTVYKFTLTYTLGELSKISKITVSPAN